MGVVALKGININAQIGVDETERRIGRDLLIDIEVEVPMVKAGQSDSIHDILNYAALSHIIHEKLKKEFHILEAAARAIAEGVLQEFPHIRRMKISISKLNPFIQGNISEARIEWNYPEDY